jgi:hypothetical protein
MEQKLDFAMAGTNGVMPIPVSNGEREREAYQWLPFGYHFWQNPYG